MRHPNDYLGSSPSKVLAEDLYYEYVWRLTSWRWFSPDDTQEDRIADVVDFKANLKTNRARSVFEKAWMDTWPEDARVWVSQRQSDKEARKRLMKDA